MEHRGEEKLSLESFSSPRQIVRELQQICKDPPDSFIYLNKQYEACLRPSAAKRDSR